MASVVSICNMALGRLGHSRQISGLTEDSVEGRLCKTYYEPSRDTVLELFHWPFAQAYAIVVAAVTDPNSDWDYAYALPVDCVRFNKIVTGNRKDTNPPPARIGNITDVGRVLFSDEQDPEIQYTMRFEDPVFFPPVFASVVAWRLATELAKPLSRSDDEWQKAMNGFGLEMSIAENNQEAETQHTQATDLSENNRARL